MPGFDVDKEEITAFDFGDTYLFTPYFDEEQLFNKLKKHYKSDNYRFEIPKDDLKEVQQILDSYFYGLVIEASPEEHYVVLEKKADSSDILRSSVLRKQRHRHNIHVMKDEISVRQAKEYGATPIQESGISTSALERKID